MERTGGGAAPQAGLRGYSAVREGHQDQTERTQRQGGKAHDVTLSFYLSKYQTHTQTHTNTHRI